MAEGDLLRLGPHGELVDGAGQPGTRRRDVGLDLADRLVGLLAHQWDPFEPSEILQRP
jgi:hypothetical protein